jgi:hypothetical protein
MNRCFIALDVVRVVQQQLHGQQQPGEASSTGSSCMQPFTSEEALRGFAADWLHSGGVSAVLDITANLLQIAQAGAAAATAGAAPAAASSSTNIRAIIVKQIMGTIDLYLELLSDFSGNLVWLEGAPRAEGVSNKALAPVWLLEGVASRLAAVTESDIRLSIAVGAAAAGGQIQPAAGDELQQLDSWLWVSGLCAGPKSGLQRVNAQQPPGGAFERSFLSCLCSLLRLAASDARVTDAPRMQG